ncbi:MAG: SDR family NAD(P)-dependent oxidoreductase [Chloroflexia bacterium]
MQLEGKVALVTGAGSGIGQAAAVLLGKEGAKVAALGRTEDELTETVEGIEREGGDAMVVLADISKPDEMEAAYRQVDERWGRLDVVFANAGINGVWAPIEELTPEEWDSTLGINLKGTFLTIKYAVPMLEATGRLGDHHRVGERHAHLQQHRRYSVLLLEGGQVAMAQMLALELAPTKVRVNVICPGAIDTEIRRTPSSATWRRSRRLLSFLRGRSRWRGDRAAPSR